MDFIASFWWLWLGIVVLCVRYPGKIRFVRRFDSLIVTACTFLFIASLIINYLQMP